MFPGLYCPGLIEAATARRLDVVGLVVFPGLYCPGLIEAGPQAPSAPWPWKVFPGLYCPGLIEGLREYGTGDAQQGVSGALLPRPH